VELGLFRAAAFAGNRKMAGAKAHRFHFIYYGPTEVVPLLQNNCKSVQTRFFIQL